MLLTTTQQDFDRRLQQNTADRIRAGKIVTERIKNQGEMGVGYKTGQVPSGGYGPGHMPSRIMPLEMPDTEHGRAMAQDSMGRGVSPDRFRYTANEMNKEEISGWKQDWKAQNVALDQRRQAQAAEQKAADDRWNTKFGDIPSVNKMAIEGAKTTADENRARMQQFYGDRAMTQQYGGMTRSTNALQSSARTLGIDEASRRARAGTMRLENEAAMARIPLEQTILQTNAQMYGHDQTYAGTRDTNDATRYGADQTLAGQREQALAPRWSPDGSSVYAPDQGMIENQYAKNQSEQTSYAEPFDGDIKEIKDAAGNVVGHKVWDQAKQIYVRRMAAGESEIDKILRLRGTGTGTGTSFFGDL